LTLEFKFPDTGEGVTEGTFLEWLVETGEEVEEDQPVAEVETDKAVVDVPAPTSGTIKELKAEPGDNVKVGDVILVMDDGDGSGGNSESGGQEEGSEPGKEETSESSEETNSPEEDSGDAEDNDTEEEEPATESDDSNAGDESQPETSKVSTSSSSGVLALPKVRKLAEDKGVDIGKVSGSGKDGRVTENDVLQAAGDPSAKAEVSEDKVDVSNEADSESGGDSNVSTPENVQATPATRKLAREKGVDLSNVNGSGQGGTITRDDVIAAAEGTGGKEKESGGEEQKQAPSGSLEQTEEGEVERVKMSGIRKTIASRMTESRFTAPHVTHVEKVDITKLVELREEKKEDVEAHLTYLPFIMKATVLALEEFPELNAELDDENDEVVLKKYYNFNIAVDTENGLMVPVVNGVDEKSIVELAGEIEDVAGRTRDGDISAGEMKGGTFSITNLGVIGGEEFTPIINYPQTAILGIGRIAETAEVVDGEVVPRKTVKLSLSYDHRVVDGATAARFMNKVAENLADPGHMLMEL